MDSSGPVVSRGGHRISTARHASPPLPSAGGSFGLDKGMNEAIYGSEADVERILACKVAPPPEFQPVYNLLNE